MPAAALIGGGISAGGNIIGSLLGSNAQSKAADKSNNLLRELFAQAKGATQPFINAGTDSIGKLQDWINPNSNNNILSHLMRLVTPGADQSAELEQTPGYQFAEGQGTRAVNNQLAARGLGGSPGAVAKGAGSFVTGLAGNTWKDVVDKLTQTFAAGGGALQNLVNTGAGAASSLFGGSSNFGNALSSVTTGLGNAQAAAATGIGNAVGGFGGNITTAGYLQKLLGQNGGGGGGLYSDNHVPEGTT